MSREDPTQDMCHLQENSFQLGTDHFNSSPDRMMMRPNFLNNFFAFIGIDFILPGYVKN